MAKHRSPHHEEILEKLEAGVSPKTIAFKFGVSYNTVMTLKNRFFDTVLVKKDKVPDPDQGNFFSNFWRERR